MAASRELLDLEREMKHLLDFWRNKATQRQYDGCIHRSAELMSRVAATPVNSIEDAAAMVRIVLLRGTCDPDNPAAALDCGGAEEQAAFATALRSARDFLEACSTSIC